MGFRTLILFSLLCLPAFSNGQAWQYTEYKPGTENNYSTFETYDKGIVTGITYINSKWISLVKLRQGGDKLWQVSYNLDSTAILWKVKPDLDGGFMLCGAITEKADLNPFLLKVNSCLEPVWFRVFREPININQMLDVDVVNDSTVICFVHGFERDFTSIVSYNHVSNKVIWHKTVKNEINILSGFFKDDKNYKIVGLVYKSTISSPVERMKAGFYLFDKEGNFPLTKIQNLYDTSAYSGGASITKIGENNYMAVVYNLRNIDNISYSNVIILKTDSFFNIRSHKVISDPLYREYPTKIVKLNDNRYFVLTEYLQNAYSEQFYPGVYLIDSNANVLGKTYIYKRTPSVSWNNTAIPYDAMVTSDNKLLVGGIYTNNAKDQYYDIYIHKFNSDLTLATKFTDTFTYDSLCTSRKVKDTTYKLPAPEIIPINANDYRLDSIPTYSYYMPLAVSRIYIENDLVSALYPNPANTDITVFLSSRVASFSNIEYLVMDIQGSLIVKGTCTTENGSFPISVSDLPAGVYLLSLKSEGNPIGLRKFVKD